MTDASPVIPTGSAAGAEAIEAVLRAELAHGDALLGTIMPIMRHLVANDDHSVFSEEIVARTRGMLEDVARQLLAAGAEGQADPPEAPRDALAALVNRLAADPALLAHVHSLALEWQLTQRLHARLALDPVLSPLLQALIASPDGATAGAAMNLLAAQARFTQAQRRMQLPLGELPADLLHAALVARRSIVGDDQAQGDGAEQKICEAFDEGRSRLGLMTRLVLGMGGGALAALAVDHAGAALFLTALAIANGQDRSLAVISTNEVQVARLSLELAAAGLKSGAIEEQFLALHPDIALPDGFEQVVPDRAAAILAQGAGYPG